MIYHHLFEKFRKQDMVTGSVIGAGHFATAIVSQQNYVERLRVPVVADLNLESAKNAFLKAEIPEDLIVYAGEEAEASRALAAGKYVYTDNCLMATTLPEIDVVTEATGVPEAGARYMLSALEHGKHVAAVSKETDSVIGPYLRKLAREKGLVYSFVDGDQPALLIQMVEWARLIGLTVISAGKARDGEFILDEKNQTVSIAADGITVHEDAVAHIPGDYMQYFQEIPKGEGMAELYLSKRDEVLAQLPGAGAFDLCELTMMANALGLKPAIPPTRKATLRITELPIAYCAKKNGGVYDDEGIIDVHTNLRRKDEGGMGGGVFMVVRCDNAYANYILTTKGQIPNHDLSTAVIYRPYHLCGVETSTTLLCAGLLGIDTGSKEYKPVWDLVRVAARDIKKGELLGGDHDAKLIAHIIPATKRAPESPAPAHLLDGRTVREDIKAGQVITYSMVDAPAGSVLWDLRLRQENTTF